jgi:hypothetical protein
MVCRDDSWRQQTLFGVISIACRTGSTPAPGCLNFLCLAARYTESSSLDLLLVDQPRMLQVQEPRISEGLREGWLREESRHL